MAEPCRLVLLTACLLCFAIKAGAQQHDTARVDQLISAARSIEMSNPDSAIIYGNEGLLLARKLKDKKRISILYRRLGNAWNVKGDLGRNFDYQNKSLELAKEIGYIPGIALTETSATIITSLAICPWRSTASRNA